MKRLLLLLIPIFFIACSQSDVQQAKQEKRHLQNVNLSGADLSDFLPDYGFDNSQLGLLALES